MEDLCDFKGVSKVQALRVSFPSSLEITQTEELNKQEALRPYELLDHIIFGNDRYFSFKENKLI